MENSYIKNLDTNSNKPLRLQGLSETAQGFMVAGYFIDSGRSLLILSPDILEAERLAQDIAFFLGGSNDVILLPQYEILPYEPVSPHPEVTALRNDALKKIATSTDKETICITTVPALMQRCEPMETLLQNVFSIKTGDELDSQKLKTFLDDNGYIFSEPVSEPGEYTFRGGIIDIFPSNRENPIRAELFGDDVESLKEFNPETQRSLERFNSIDIPPLKEAGYSSINMQQLEDKLLELEKRHCVSLAELRTKFVDKEFFPAMENYLPYFTKEPSSPIDFLKSELAVIECEPERIEEKESLFLNEIKEGYKEAIENKRYYPAPDELFESAKLIDSFLKKRKRIEFAEISTEEESPSTQTLLSVEPPRYKGAFSRYIYDCKQNLAKGISSLLVVSSAESIERVQKLFLEEDLGVRHLSQGGMAGFSQELFLGLVDEPLILVTKGQVNSGFISESLKIAVTTEEELYGRSRITGKRKKRSRQEAFSTDFSDISPGDYVVHRDNGIGIYHGTKIITASASQDEYLEIEYADNQMLFLAMQSVYLIEKYASGGGACPKLDRMGGTTWQKTRDKVKKGIMKMAGELLELQAKRETGKAVSFSSENSFNSDFADSFDYTETEGQAGAIEDVRRDMASDKPMDRLICGDVGYGKTEIAMRATFACSVEGKQTAILVPTTLLASQHYENFKARMEKFGVKVAMLSRFAGKDMSKEALAGMADGTVDVVIGTHKLLQKSVAFKDLGLVIIDEEQRFGVKHKEQLKKLRATVDLLTLTATPIPRTLHMSLSGIKEISVINSPPPGRRSIKTFIRRTGDGIIKEAVNRELGRGGQLFFVHNKIETMSGMAKYLSDIVPQARVAIAHGQMSGNELEEVMDKFVKHKVDMLLCTTIIESGLDIPNANTIIINRADKFGLGQLYQLRGRVGRDRHRAYAYMLVPDVLTPIARKRISAIEELSELGSGFKLASRDMEIRGTGNFLGAKQSGHVTAVGFETYCRLLKEAVEELKSGKKGRSVDTVLNVDFVGKLDEEYIPMADQRMNYYNRLHSACDIESIKEIRLELNDKYGVIPERAEKLMLGALLRLTASKLGIEKVSLKGTDATLSFAEHSIYPAEVTTKAMEKFPGKLKPVGDNKLRIDLTGNEDDGRVESLIALLQLVEIEEE